MSLNLKYRTANKEDINQLLSLGLLSYGQYRNDLDIEHFNQLEENLNNQDIYLNLLKVSNCFICLDKSQIIGMAFLIPSGHPTEIFQADWCYLRMVGVHPNYSGNGIGKHLTQLCIDYAVKSNEKIIALHTSEFMHSARHIYEKMGFTQAREIPKILGKRYWLYTFEINANI